MIASERALFIMRRINELGVVNLKDIAAQMGTSETTVRRDFEKLEKQGKLRRVPVSYTHLTLPTNSLV